MQQGRPVAYFSKLLGVRAQQKSIYEKELIAICLAILKWKPYLLGRHFIVRSDQQSLRFLMEQREVNHEYQKWVTKLLGFDFEIQYKTGASNKVADALSRKQSGTVALNVLVTSPVVSWEELDKEISQDIFLQRLRNEMQSPDRSESHFCITDNRVLYKGRCVIPRSSKFCSILLHEYHSSAVGGHAGELKTYMRLATDWYWQGMRRDVAEFVKSCVVC